MAVAVGSEVTTVAATTESLAGQLVERAPERGAVALADAFEQVRPDRGGVDRPCLLHRRPPSLRRDDLDTVARRLARDQSALLHPGQLVESLLR